MRLLPVLVLIAALLPAAALADVGGGNGAGVGARGYAAGLWDIWHVDVGAAGTLNASLTWVDSPGGADYDMTLWTPGADADGVLSQSEMLASAWTVQNSPGETLSYPVTPHAAPYVITVEPANAKLETYYLTETGGHLVKTCHPRSPPGTCLPGAQGVKQR